MQDAKHIYALDADLSDRCINYIQNNIKDQKIRLTEKIEEFKSNTTCKLNNLEESIVIEKTYAELPEATVDLSSILSDEDRAA